NSLGFSAIPCFALAALNIPRRYVEIKMEIAKAGGSSVRLTLFGQACKNTGLFTCTSAISIRPRMDSDEHGFNRRKGTQRAQRSVSASMLFSASAGEKVAKGRMRVSLGEWSEGRGEEPFCSTQSRSISGQRQAPFNFF